MTFNLSTWLPAVRFAATLGEPHAKAALPWLEKIAPVQPQILEAVQAGREALAEINQKHPHLIEDLRGVFTAIQGAPVKAEDALRLAGPLLVGRDWSPAEEARFDPAKGNVSEA